MLEKGERESGGGPGLGDTSWRGERRVVRGEEKRRGGEKKVIWG